MDHSDRRPNPPTGKTGPPLITAPKRVSHLNNIPRPGMDHANVWKRIRNRPEHRNKLLHDGRCVESDVEEKLFPIVKIGNSSLTTSIMGRGVSRQQADSLLYCTRRSASKWSAMGLQFPRSRDRKLFFSGTFDTITACFPIRITFSRIRRKLELGFRDEELFILIAIGRRSHGSLLLRRLLSASKQL
ncbi:hypothetical protein Rs2_50624 [Raphanus sativus]|nr:hypothetical protein Rs2_50624 [Raphanus sativus]